MLLSEAEPQCSSAENTSRAQAWSSRTRAGQQSRAAGQAEEPAFAGRSPSSFWPVLTQHSTSIHVGLGEGVCPQWSPRQCPMWGCNGPHSQADPLHSGETGRGHDQGLGELEDHGPFLRPYAEPCSDPIHSCTRGLPCLTDLELELRGHLL